MSCSTAERLRSMKITSTRSGKINFTKLVEFKRRLATQNISKIFALRQTVSQLRFDSILQNQVPTYQSKNGFDKTTHISKVSCLCVFDTGIPDIKKITIDCLPANGATAAG